MKKSPIFKNPIIFMILLDCIGMIITIVETIHIKTSIVDGDSNDTTNESV